MLLRWLKTFQFILKKHKGQKDKGGKPYFLHPLYVSIHCRGHDARIVGLLHDVLEDTDTDEKELISMGFSKTVVDAVKLLTRDKKEPYDDYVLRLKENPIAMEVKTNDLKHNMNLKRLKVVTEKDRKRVIRYKNALALLTE